MLDPANMNLEYILTNTKKEDWIIYITLREKDFPELIKLSISNKQPYSWRASWLLSSCMDNNDPRVKKHIKKIVEILPSRQHSQQRALLKVLEKMEIEPKYEGQLFDTCLNIWQGIHNNPSLRFQALKIMVSISKKYPDLMKEIHLLTDKNHTDNLSAVIKKSIHKLLSK